MLTSKQKELLMFIHERLKETGVPPSFDEMKEALDLKSKSGIHRLITALEERGFVRRLPHRARAMEIVRLPDSVPQPLAQRSRGFSPSVIEGSLGRVPQVAEGESLPQTVSVPVMGRIAAGVPVEAIQTRLSTIEVPPELLSKGEHYALEVKGDSMIEAGILEGDTIIVRKCDDANNGDIVVALVDEEEATLKRLRRRGDSIALKRPTRLTRRASSGPTGSVCRAGSSGCSAATRPQSSGSGVFGATIVVSPRESPLGRLARRFGIGPLRRPGAMPPQGCHRLRPDRQTFDVERVRAIGLQHAPIDDDACGPAGLADGERRDDDIGQAAILLERAGIANKRHRLALDHADAAEQIAAEHIFIGRCGGVAFIAVSEQPVVDAVACGSRRRKDEIAAPGSERSRGALPLDQHVGPFGLGREREANGNDHETKCPRSCLP